MNNLSAVKLDRLVTIEEPTTIATGRPEYPAPEARPCYRVFDDWLETDGRKLRAGVWYFAMRASKGDGEPTLVDDWIASPLHIEAVTHDQTERNFGRLLRFRNSNGKWLSWAMPMELLKGDGSDLRGELLSMGVQIDPRGRNTLSSYLQSIEPTRRVLAATTIGWTGRNFVLPGEVIGPNPGGVIFQSPERGADSFTRSGTLEAWLTEVAGKAINNPILTLALSSAFAGPLLEKTHAEGGGIHLVGDSSTGKTTAAEVAASVWGGAGFKRSWRATANGTEGAAALSNDTLLILDEISEAEPREIGQIAYLLTNGSGKQRASRTGAAKEVKKWKTFILSTGERTIATAMLEGGQRAKAGQAVRILDIQCRRKFGAWDDLHGAADGRSFSDKLKTAAGQHHGHAGREYLERLTCDDRDFGNFLADMKELPAFSPPGASEQERRAGARFALIALAGELATEYGLTGWAEGNATEAASIGFQAWLAGRDGAGANHENLAITRALGEFLERHGDSRFSDKNSESVIPVRDRAGWWQNDLAGGREYLFNGTGLREALKGYDFSRALDVLEQAGVMPKPGPVGRAGKSERIGGTVFRVYRVNLAAFGT